MAEGGLELLFVPRDRIDPGNQVNGILDAVGEGTTTLLDELKEHGGDTDALGELGLSHPSNPADVVQGVDLFGDTGWAGEFHLTKVTYNQYYVNYDYII